MVKNISDNKFTGTAGTARKDSIPNEFVDAAFTARAAGSLTYMLQGH